jgi:16S rRNA A1518/A1519 N6-dimethyltransferase RsmA/KsgA/DIM1 with predicted DNA glycosylase/AP lyase activity
MDYLVLLILLGVMFLLLKEFYNILFCGYAPFIPTGRKAIRKAIDEMDIPPRGTIYELGCGHAGFLRELRKKYPDANLIGVEYGIVPYLIGQIQNSLSGSNIKFIRKNFFKVDLRDADAVYCFLSIRSMAELEKKI